MPPSFTRVDLLALIALTRLGDEAYGVTIRDEIRRVTGRDVSIAAVYAALERLGHQRLVEPWRSEPRPERGGRSRRQFRLTTDGRRALEDERGAMRRLWQDVVPEPGTNGGAS
jgi:DNA-binding PadR family transcriptional regulator